MRSIMKTFIIPISSKSDFEEIIDLLHKNNYIFPSEPQEYKSEMTFIGVSSLFKRIYYSMNQINEIKRNDTFIIFKEECAQLLKLK